MSHQHTKREVSSQYLAHALLTSGLLLHMESNLYPRRLSSLKDRNHDLVVNPDLWLGLIRCLVTLSQVLNK